MAKKAPSRTEAKEPHFEELKFLYKENFPWMTKKEIFEKWAEMILPDVPLIELKQFENWTRNVSPDEVKGITRKTEEKMRDKEIEVVQKKPMEIFQERSAVALSLLEQKTRVGMDLALDDALTILYSPDAQLKNKYYALSVVSAAQKGVQKEKDLGIKAHREKREAVGLFAKLAGQAMTGEITMRDVELLEGQQSYDDSKTEIREGSPQPATA